MSRLEKAIIAVLYPIGITITLILIAAISPLLALSVVIFALFVIAYIFIED